MPSRAKLTTRGISTTTVTTETLPKNLALTNNELDSNFINLRDQTFSIVGDDSSGIDIKAGDTIKFAGAGGATITATGSTITVTAGGGGGGTGDLTIVGSTISGPSNADINLTAGGTGDINLNADTVRLGDENASVVLTSNGATSGDFTIKIGSDSTPYIKLTDAGTIEIAPDINSTTFLKSDITTLGSGSSSGTLNTNGAVDLILSTNTSGTSSRIELKPGTNGGINIWPNGTGKIQLDNHYWPNIDGSSGQVLTTDGAGILSWSSVSSSTGDLTIVGSEISGPSNGDISITPGGTGNVVLKTETLRIGDPDVATEGDVINIFTATDQSLYIATSNLDANSTSIKLIEESGDEQIELNVPSTSSKGIDMNATWLRLGYAGTGGVISTYGTGSLELRTNNFGILNTGKIEITGGSNANISILPHGTGKILLDNNYWPNTDGTVGQVLTTDGAGNLSWGNATAQGITFVGDDSTGTRVSDNETFKIAGASNITTAVSGDILTITGPNLTNYAQKTDTAITLVGDDSTGTAVTLGETFKIAGGTGITTSVGADTLFINATSTSSVGDFTITGTTISAETTNADITITSSGTGNFNVDMDTLRLGDSGSESNITTNGTGSLVLSTNNVGVNSGTIKINEGTNGNIELAPNGTGDVLLTADTVRVGDSNTDATITTNGTGDLILNTNAGTSSGSITIADAANGNISILNNGTGELVVSGAITTSGATDLVLDTNAGTNSGTITIADGTNGTITVATNGTGYLDLHKSFDSTNFPQTPASGNTNWAGATSTSYMGTRMLYSNQAQGDITQPDDRVRANTRLISIKHPNDSTTYNDTDYVIQNTDLIVLDINGQSFGSTLTGSRGAGVRGEANNVILKNTAGGTKTGPNLIGGSAFVEVENAHGGDLTAVNVMGFRSFISNRANTGEFTRMTNAYGYLAEGIGAGGSGTSGTNRFVTNEYGFFTQGSTSSNLVTNYYGFYANTGATATNKYAFYSADDAYLSRLGTIERVREKQNALTSSSTITVDADLAPVHKVTLAENTQFGITGLSTGQTVTIIIVQDGTGNRTATFTSDTSTTVKFAGGTPTLSTAANAIDVVKIYNDGTNFLGVIEKAFA